MNKHMKNMDIAEGNNPLHLTTAAVNVLQQLRGDDQKLKVTKKHFSYLLILLF